MDAQREQLEELYEGKMTILKDLLTDHYQEKMQVCSGQCSDLRKVAVGWEGTLGTQVQEDLYAK